MEQRERLGLLFQSLAELHNCAVELFNQNESKPKDGSPLGNEIQEQAQLAGAWAKEPVGAAFFRALLRAAHANDYLEALQRLIEGTPLASPAAAVARSALEISARAWWILEPGLGARRRVARSMTDRLHDLRQQAKQEGEHYRYLLSARRESERLGIPLSGVEPQPSNHSRLIIETIVQTATRLGFQLKREFNHPDREVIGIEDYYPSATKIVDDLLTSGGRGLGANLFRVTSSPKHGEVTGLTQMLEIIDHPSDPNLKFGGIALTDDAACSLIFYPLVGYVILVERFIEVCAWDPRRWFGCRQTTLERALAVMRDLSPGTSP